MDILPLDNYDKIIISLSGGKDSLSCLLLMVEAGVQTEKLELWHQSVDGYGQSKRAFFDWPSTEGYVRTLADHFGLRLFWQWREYGYFRELYRQDQRTGDVYFKADDELLTWHLPTTKGELSTRRKFPQKTASLRTRWCSAAMKIDPARRCLSARPDLKGDRGTPKNILFVTGERRQESAARAKYKKAELHATHTRSRLVHHYRPVIDFKEEDVWQLIEKHRILPHPAYFLGFPRLSCRSCIFYSPAHWATLAEVDPATVRMLQGVEEELGFTIDNKLSLQEMVRIGKSKLSPENHRFIKLAIEQWESSIVADEWILPTGAFGEGGGSL